jgi:hypothetical protein
LLRRQGSERGRKGEKCYKNNGKQGRDEDDTVKK